MHCNGICRWWRSSRLNQATYGVKEIYPRNRYMEMRYVNGSRATHFT